jgi:parallel beta-helix repeat protein
MTTRAVALNAMLAVILPAAAFSIAVTPALATHVQCGDVITQDTTLDSDLENCPVDGVVIGADGVTLDLNGHEIDGAGGGPLYGGGGINGDAIYGETSDGVDDTRGFDGLVVKGGEIEEFDIGVNLRYATGALLSGLEPYSTTIGVLLVKSRGNGIVDNHIHHTGYGIYPVASSDNQIAHNRIESSAFGMYPVESDRNVIAGNSILGSGVLGIQVTTGSSDNLIMGNEILRSGSTGMLISNAYRNVVSDNLVADHPGAGISLNDADGSIVRLNRVAFQGPRGPFFDFQGYGISAQVEADGVKLERNSVMGYRIGYLIRSSVGITLTRNVARDNVTDGIAVLDGATRTLIERNEAYANGDDGIDVEDAGAKVRLNQADWNDDLGIEAVPGVNGGGNRAANNGNPAQCVGITCN